MTVDQICKMEVAPAAVASIEYEGRTIHFCSNGCRDAFLQGYRQQRHREAYELVIIGSDTVEGVAIREPKQPNRNLAVAGVSIAIGMQPNSALVADLVDLNERGEIKNGPDCSTATTGLFAAGDVTDAYGKRIIIAAGEGAKAALAARQYLLNRKKCGKTGKA